MNQIALVGEAWGAEEEKERTPFVGYSGWQLTKMLDEAGISRADCFLTNVFNFRPVHNKLESLYGSREEGLQGYPPIEKSKYIRGEFESELRRLGDELVEVNPNVVVALGNTALWALCGRTKITQARGSTCVSTHTVSGYKVLPTYHPAVIHPKRQWELRPIIIADFHKVERESHYPEIRRPKRKVWIEPNLEDIERFYDEHITSRSEQGLILAVDIETAGTQITCIGFGYPDLAIVIPFFDSRRKERSYWKNSRDEFLAWKIIKRILEDKRIRKSFQNGLYDIAFIWRTKGVKVFGAAEDTMLLHHALQPESLKGLGFLGSIYTDEGSWKQMREKTKTIKRDD